MFLGMGPLEFALATICVVILIGALFFAMGGGK